MLKTRLTTSQLDKARSLCAAGTSQQDAAKQIGVTASVLSRLGIKPTTPVKRRRRKTTRAPYGSRSSSHLAASESKALTDLILGSTLSKRTKLNLIAQLI